MSLEAALKANTEAIEKLTATMEKLAKSGGAGGGKGGGGAKAKKVSVDDLKAKAGEYLNLVEDRGERDQLKEPLKRCLKHYGIDKFPDLPEDKRPEMMEKFDILIGAFNEGGVEAAMAADIGVPGEDDDGDII